MFVEFQPAISEDAHNKISGQIRRWRLHRWIGFDLVEIAAVPGVLPNSWTGTTASTHVLIVCSQNAITPAIDSAVSGGGRNTGWFEWLRQ
jgi:hypothetical protein